jgi:hypothetical protein
MNTDECQVVASKYFKRVAAARIRGIGILHQDDVKRDVMPEGQQFRFEL